MSDAGKDDNGAIARFGSGRAVHRVEDAALLAGRGRFVDNVAEPGQTVIAFQRSPHAHARIVAIDAEAARAMPGVLAVYTGAELAAAGIKPMPTTADFKRGDGRKTVGPPRRALAHEVARYVGEAVVAVVAESREAARDAIDSVAVEYEELPAVADVRAATAPGAPAVTPEAADNIAAEMRHGDAVKAAAAFECAALRIELYLVNQRVSPVAMEPRSSLASFDAASGRLTVRISNQMPTAVAAGLAGALPGIAQEQIHVLVGDVGGGFGMKTGMYPEDIVVAHAARTLGRPVHWQADRSEEFLSGSAGRDVSSRAELALDGEGKVLALRVRSLANVGAYPTPAGVAIQLLIGPWVSTSIYDIGVVDLHMTAVLTNTTPTGAYRGAGRPEAIYIIERLFDAAAREMKLDPAELRRRNMIRPEQMPYRNQLGQTYDCGSFEKILDQGLALADWHGFAARREQSRSRGVLRGRGIASFLEWTGGNALEEKVSVDVTPDGFIEIFSATQAMGQGIATSYTQLAVDAFGVAPEKIRIVQGDTARGNGFGSAGSRSLFTGGSAVRVASERTIDHAKTLAGEALEASAGDIEYRAGRFAVVGTDLGIDLFALAGKQPGQRIHLEASAVAGGPTWPNACHVCEVEIDPESGDVRVVAYCSVNDIGRVVSPTIVRGQVDGGAVQGLGQALCEQVVYDGASGQLVTGSFMDYAVPRADIAVAFRTEFDTSIPTATNALGVKGVGELGTIGATPAVMNAVIDALDHAGLGRAAEEIQMPATAERVWQALRGVAVPR
ncbi:MAG: xanthine dehydrogenase family protein molybdopterin-binding subunit [Caldimonas sp.]